MVFWFWHFLKGARLKNSHSESGSSRAVIVFPPSFLALIVAFSRFLCFLISNLLMNGWESEWENRIFVLLSWSKLSLLRSHQEDHKGVYLTVFKFSVKVWIIITVIVKSNPTCRECTVVCYFAISWVERRNKITSAQEEEARRDFGEKNKKKKNPSINK